MASDWSQTTLGECADFFSGGTPRKSNAEFWNGTIPWISGKDLKSFYLNDGEDHITAEGAEAGSRLIPPGTILLLVRGMTLHNDVPVAVVTRESAFNQDIKAIRARIACRSTVSGPLVSSATTQVARHRSRRGTWNRGSRN